MKTIHTRARRVLLVATAGAFALTVPSVFAQTARNAPPAGEQPRTGLAAKLASDDAVIGQAADMELNTLLEHLFKKNNIPKDDQAAFLAVRALADLDNPSLNNKQRMDRISQVAAGIRRVIAVKKNPTELMNVAGQLVQFGAQKPVNLMEYFGENPRTQSQLRPIAEAVDLVYAKAGELAAAAMEDIAKRITVANQNELGPQHDRMEQIVGMAKFSGAMNKHALALSFDKAAKERAAHAEAGIAVLKEYLDPQFEVQNQVRVALGKLYIDQGTPQALGEARKILGEVLADKNAAWASKLDAIYFSAIADVTARDFNAARKRAAEMDQFLAQNPAPDANAKTAAEGVRLMLEFRVNAGEAEQLGPVAGKAVNEKAIAALNTLLTKQPALQGVINDQLMARMPDQPDVKSLPTLLLQAMVFRGRDELARPEGEQVDRKALNQALAAANEVAGRAGRDAQVNPQLASDAALLKGYFHLKLGNDVDAAQAFLDHVEKFKDPARRQVAFDLAGAAVLKLRKDRPKEQGTVQAYNRFIATAVDVFNLKEFFYEYARLLQNRVGDAMQAGGITDAARTKLIADAQKAADLLAKVEDPKLKMYAKFYELFSYDQILDLAPKDAKVAQWVAKAQALAAEVFTITDQVIKGQGDAAAQADAKRFRPTTALLAAGLASHDLSPQRNASLQRAVDLLANFEKDVQGLPNANALLGEAFYMRVSFLITLGKPDEALESLGKYLETKGPDEGIGIVVDMVKALEKEYEVAEGSNDRDRMRELAGHRAKVINYLVDRAGKSTNPKVTELLPKYRELYARSLQRAAVLETDEVKKKGYLATALQIVSEDLKKKPDDAALQLSVALLNFDLGNHAQAQPVFTRLLDARLLGKPMIEQETADGFRTIHNEQFWEVSYKHLVSNVELNKQKAEGFNQQTLMDDTKMRLKTLYIQYAEPGGPRWHPKFEELRKSLLPDWTPEAPPSQGSPATQPQTAGK